MQRGAVALSTDSMLHQRQPKVCAPASKRANAMHWSGFDEGAVCAVCGDGAVSGSGPNSPTALGADRTRPIDADALRDIGARRHSRGHVARLSMRSG